MDYASPSGATALAMAIAARNEAVSDLLLGSGASITLEDRTGNLPLHAAAQAGDVEMVKKLIAKGALVDAKNRAGQTPLMVAARANRPARWLRLAPIRNIRRAPARHCSYRQLAAADWKR